MTQFVPDTQRLQTVRTAIIEWYAKCGRTFPWRNSDDAYEIIIAEILLRRTTAAAVDRVYSDFVKRYDTVERLARSRGRSVERLLSTLGLQSIRARDLKRMALMIVNNYDGKVPAYFKDLIALPGVGEYIANAVLNFAFKQPQPLVDGNVIHLVNRVFSCNFGSPSEKSAWEFMQHLGGASQDARLYWGIIDLVATVCLRKRPRCEICPLRTHCDSAKI